MDDEFEVVTPKLDLKVDLFRWMAGSSPAMTIMG
jgi:hypothetical protein